MRAEVSKVVESGVGVKATTRKLKEACKENKNKKVKQAPVQIWFDCM